MFFFSEVFFLPSSLCESMEAKLLSASSPALPAVHGTAKFSRPSFLLTVQTREFPRFKFDCSARLSKKDQPIRASTAYFGYKKKATFFFSFVCLNSALYCWKQSFLSLCLKKKALVFFTFLNLEMGALSIALLSLILANVGFSFMFRMLQLR